MKLFAGWQLKGYMFLLLWIVKFYPHSFSIPRILSPTDGEEYDYSCHIPAIIMNLKGYNIFMFTSLFLLFFSFFFTPFFLFYENVLHYVQLTVKIWPFSLVKVFHIFVESSKASLVYFKTSSQRNYGGWPNALHYPWALSLPLWATSLVIQIIDDWSG